MPTLTDDIKGVNVKAKNLFRWLIAGSLVAIALVTSATPLTDDIRALNAANKTLVDAKLAAIDAQPSGGAPAPLAWPAGTNLLGGTPSNILAYPPGFPGDSGGFPEPSKSRRMVAADRVGMGYIFGDSILQPIPPTFFSPFAENFAVGGRHLRMLINELHTFPGLARGSFVVFQGGANEFAQTQYYGSRMAAVETILLMYSSKLKPWITGRWYIMHLVPLVNTHPEAADYNAAVAAINAGLATAMAGSAAQVTIIPVNPDMLEPDGSLKASMAAPDKQHLSAQGSYLYSLPVYNRLRIDGINPP